MKRAKYNLESDGVKRYMVDEVLETTITDWLQIREAKQKLTEEGIKLTENDELKIRKTDRMKVYVLDTVIFPSMANLIFFFEAISTNKNLADAFEDELVELLGNQKIRASSHSRNEARSSSQQFMVNPLARLVLAILTIHNLPKQINRSKKIKTHEIPKPSSDFRVGLMYQLLCIIGDKLDALLSAEYHTNSQIWHSAIQDFNRVKGWLALLTRTVEENPQTYDRIIEPTKYTKNS